MKADRRGTSNVLHVTHSHQRTLQKEDKSSGTDTAKGTGSSKETKGTKGGNGTKKSNSASDSGETVSGFSASGSTADINAYFYATVAVSATVAPNSISLGGRGSPKGDATGGGTKKKGSSQSVYSAASTSEISMFSYAMAEDTTTGSSLPISGDGGGGSPKGTSTTGANKGTAHKDSSLSSSIASTSIEAPGITSIFSAQDYSAAASSAATAASSAVFSATVVPVSEFGLPTTTDKSPKGTTTKGNNTKDGKKNGNQR
jgi:hypothetical protein